VPRASRPRWIFYSGLPIWAGWSARRSRDNGDAGAGACGARPAEGEGGQVDVSAGDDAHREHADALGQGDRARITRYVPMVPLPPGDRLGGVEGGGDGAERGGRAAIAAD